MKQRSRIEVLLVEDNPADIRLMQEAFKTLTTPLSVTIARDGQQAADILGEVSAGRRPLDFILLDLNLPVRDGREILRDLKADPVLARIPVVILSTSSSPRDIHAAYAMHANSYLTKPGDLHEFFELVRGIDVFWFRAATLPTRVPAFG
jgi:two-component system, chemotaxis family, response regulator Rcp1